MKVGYHLMHEKDFVATMCSSIRARGGFGQKMPDPSYQELMRGAPPRPYDMYYVLLGQCVHLEAKFLPGYQCFALDKVEDHQYENLLRIKLNASLAPPGSIEAIVAVAVWEPRKIYDIFFFDILLLSRLRDEMKSIKKKELLALKALNKCLTVSKDDIKMENVSEVLICDRSEIPRV
jgi:hypothetical protein